MSPKKNLQPNGSQPSKKSPASFQTPSTNIPDNDKASPPNPNAQSQKSSNDTKTTPSDLQGLFLANSSTSPSQQPKETPSSQNKSPHNASAPRFQKTPIDPNDIGSAMPSNQHLPLKKSPESPTQTEVTNIGSAMPLNQRLPSQKSPENRTQTEVTNIGSAMPSNQRLPSQISPEKRTQTEVTNIGSAMPSNNAARKGESTKNTSGNKKNAGSKDKNPEQKR